MSYWRTCLTGEHVVLESVLLEYMSYRRPCLVEGLVLQKIFFLLKGMSTREHVLLEDISYCRTCLIGEHVLLENMYYWRTCLTRDMSYGWTCLREGRHVIGGDMF